MEISVVVPVYNEEGNVGHLAQEIFAALEDFDFEIIFVDDGSSDTTAVRLQKIAGTDDRLRVLRHLNNSGQSAGLSTGVRYARAEWVATLDGDGQNDPADIPKLLAAARSTLPAPVCVCGQRNRRQDNGLRKLSSRVANWVRSAILGDGIADSGCGLKLFRRDAFLDLPRFDHMHRFLPALFLRDGGTVISLPVNHRSRRHGTSKYGVHNRLWVGIVDLLGVYWLLRRGRRPAGVREEIRP